MSRQELAEAVNAHVFHTSGRVTAMNAQYVGRLERGLRRCPRPDSREALRAVLGAASDEDLGFGVRPRTADERFVRHEPHGVGADQIARQLNGAEDSAVQLE